MSKKDITIYKNGENFFIKSNKDIKWIGKFDGCGQLFSKINTKDIEVYINSSIFAKNVYLLDVVRYNQTFVKNNEILILKLKNNIWLIKSIKY